MEMSPDSTVNWSMGKSKMIAKSCPKCDQQVRLLFLLIYNV